MAGQQNDPWAASDPWGGSASSRPIGSGGYLAPPGGPAEVPKEAPKSGKLYTDTWNTSSQFLVDFQGRELCVACPRGSFPEERAQVEGNQVTIWGLTATVKQDCIEFSNGSVWQAEAAQAAQSSNATTHSASGWGDFQATRSQQNSWGQQSGWGQQNAGGQQNGGAWNSGSQPDQDHIKKIRWRDFSAAQDWYKQNNILPGPSTQDGDHLFDYETCAGGGEDFNLYDQVQCQVSGPNSEHIPQLTTFEQMYQEFKEAIPAQLEENIRRCGFSRPTPVQKFAIPVGLAGRDVMCCAQTGSGKTAAYLVPMLASMIKNSRGTGGLDKPFEGPCEPDTLIMSPTRELCLQIFDDVLKFCHKTDFRCVRVYGQENAKIQINEISKGADVCVATPGRLHDFASAGILKLARVNCLVLDEADRMLEMGMDTAIRELVEDLDMPTKENRQTMMFSATFPQAIQKLAGKYLYDHLFVAVGAVGSAACTVTQQLVQVNKDEKPEALIHLIDDWLRDRKEGQRMLVFTNSKLQAKGLDEKLWDQNVANTGALHGDLQQHEREANLTRFRDGHIDVMVATDVASRGLDISGVTHVVNYDLPFEISVYVQRIGRTGRIGHRGTAISFVTMDKDNFQDREEVLRELPGKMKNAPNTIIPEWLTAKVDELKKGKWDAQEEEEKKEDDKKDARAWSSWAETEKEMAGGDWGASSSANHGGNSWSNSGAWHSDSGGTGAVDSQGSAAAAGTWSSAPYQ